MDDETLERCTAKLREAARRSDTSRLRSRCIPSASPPTRPCLRGTLGCLGGLGRVRRARRVTRDGAEELDVFSRGMRPHGPASLFASASTLRRDATWRIANSNMFAVTASTRVTTSSLARSASRRTPRGSTDSAPMAVLLFMGVSFGFFICFVASHGNGHWKPT